MKIFGSLRELVSVVFRKSTYSVTVEPSTASANTTFQLPVADGGATKTLVDTTSTQSLSGKYLSATGIDMLSPTGYVQVRDHSMFLRGRNDTTKVVRFDVESLTPATVQTLMTPDATGTIVLEDNTATLTNKTIAAASNTITTATSGNLTATELNSALAELQSDIDTRATSSSLSVHTEASSGVHGVTGSVVGTTDTQTLTNKTLTNPTINAGGGTLVVPATATPSQTATGSVVYGTTDGFLTVGTGSATKTLVDTDTPSQTLSNKILAGASITASDLKLPLGTGNNAEGQIQWDSTADKLRIGTSSSTVELVDLGSSQTLTSKTLTSPSISNPSFSWTSGSLVVPTATVPSQTAEGSVVWDSDDDLLTVGTGTGRKTMADTSTAQTLDSKTLTTPNLQGMLWNDAYPVTITSNALTSLTANTTVHQVSSAPSSLRTIAADSDGRTIMVQNLSGSDFVVEDNTGNIRTGTGSNITLKANASLLFRYEISTTKWYVVGGSSSAASSSGEINAVLNPSAATDATGWTNATQNTSNSPLSPITSTALAIANTAAAEGATSGGYYTISSMPSGLRNKKLKLEFYYTTPATDVYAVSVRSTAPSAARMALSTDSGSVTTLPANTTGKFVTYFDADSSTAYTINFTRTSGSTGTLYITNVIVGPGIQPQGAVVGEWQSYTPSITNTGSKTTLSIFGKWRRVGSSMEVTFFYSGNSTAAGAGAAQVQISIPSGYTIDSSKLNGSLNTDINYVGTYNDFAILTASQYGPAMGLSPISTTTIGFNKYASGSWLAQNDLNIARAVQLEGTFSVPIAEWSGSGTVNLAQNDVEYAYTTGTWDSDDSTTGYGSSGATISGALSTTRLKTVTFQTPVQPTDELLLEIQIAGAGDWLPMIGTFDHGVVNSAIQPIWFINGSAATDQAGVGISRVSGSTTQAKVFFGTAPSGYYNGTSWIKNSWATFTSGSKWRLKKSSGGQAVGFGAATATSNGLVKGGTVPGSTSGAAIAAGYIGEKITWTTAPINQVLTTSEADWTNATITLSAGTWLITANIYLDVFTGAVAGNNTSGYWKMTDSLNNVVQLMDKSLLARTSAAAINDLQTTVSGSCAVSISSSTTYKIRAYYANGAGSGGAYIVNQAQARSEFYAVRIG